MEHASPSFVNRPKSSRTSKPTSTKRRPSRRPPTTPPPVNVDEQIDRWRVSRLEAENAITDARNNPVTLGEPLGYRGIATLREAFATYAAAQRAHLDALEAALADPLADGAGEVLAAEGAAMVEGAEDLDEMTSLFGELASVGESIAERGTLTDLEIEWLRDEAARQARDKQARELPANIDALVAAANCPNECSRPHAELVALAAQGATDMITMGWRLERLAHDPLAPGGFAEAEAITTAAEGFVELAAKIGGLATAAEFGRARLSWGDEEPATCPRCHDPMVKDAELCRICTEEQREAAQSPAVHQ